jgi:hypothetical protein
MGNDYAIECRSTNKNMVKVNTKANEIYDSYGLNKVWGIATDAEKWHRYQECTKMRICKPK